LNVESIGRQIPAQLGQMLLLSLEQALLETDRENSSRMKSSSATASNSAGSGDESAFSSTKGELPGSPTPSTLSSGSEQEDR